MKSEPTTPAVWTAKHLRLAIHAPGVALWSWNVDDDTLTMDACGHGLWDVPLNRTVTFEDLSDRILPADRDRVRAAFSATRGLVGPYEIDFRIISGNEVRWISARGQGADHGMVGRIMFGIFLDVTGRKQAEEGHELLAGEMSHRVKNLLAIATGLTAITSRSTSTTTDMARELTQRLTALDRAHELVRPLPGSEARRPSSATSSRSCWRPTTTWAPSAAASGCPFRGWAWARPPPRRSRWSSASWRPIRSSIGALSVATGTLDVSCCSREDVVVIAWTERGGPAVTALSGPGGYGSRLLTRAMTRQLDGAITREWNEAGVVVTLTMNKAYLVA